MSVLTQNNLLPFRQIAESEVINLFALDGTGLNGQLVALVTGNQDPATSDGSYAGGVAVGASFANAFSLRHLVTRRVRATQAGDTKFNTLGITTHTTAEYDENGRKLTLENANDTKERGFVPSGQAVPIAARGIVTLKLSQIIGTPIAGYPAVISTGGNGKVEVLDPSVTSIRATMTGAGTYSGHQIIGKFISNSGSAFGGYAQLKLEL